MYKRTKANLLEAARRVRQAQRAIKRQCWVQPLSETLKLFRPQQHGVAFSVKGRAY